MRNEANAVSNDVLEQAQQLAAANPALRRVDMEHVEIRSGAIGALDGILSGFSSIALLADATTYDIAGLAVARECGKGGRNAVPVVLASECPVPDERTVGEAVLGLPDSLDCLVCVGSGTVTDLARYLSFRLQLPFVAVGTAPSMDGYTSSVAPLIIGGMKTTLNAHMPKAVVLDTTVLEQAPMHMKAAGVGDLLGKRLSRLDWYVAQAANGDTVHEDLLAYLHRAVDRCVDTMFSDGDEPYRPGTAGPLAAGLVASGLAITLHGSSRPASGSDHHIAHFLELQGLMGRVPAHLHGEKVAFGTHLMTRLYNRVFRQSFDSFAKHVQQAAEPAGAPDEAREERLRRAYGPVADQALAAYREGLADTARRNTVLERLEPAWPGLARRVAQELQSPEETDRLLARARLTVDPDGLGYDHAMIEDALLCAKEIRRRYTLLSLLDELGVLEALVDEMMLSE
jgi:glycerol-1-phosphate dehydrogenase [NAD(P)+]